MAIAEWGLQVSRIGAIPHLLAVLAQSLVKSEVANVRLVLPPKLVKQLAQEAGWTLHHEQTLPSPRIKDGIWEVQAALAIKSNGASNESSNSFAMDQHLEALQLAVDATGGASNVQTMDVWAAVFK